MARINVAITHYERLQALIDLVDSLLVDGAMHDLQIAVYDDGSDELSVPRQFMFPSRNVSINDMRGRHRGKQGFWAVIDRVFKDERDARSADYFVLLQDDMKIVPHFFDQCIELWEAIPDPRKVSINPLVDSRAGQPSWTNAKPQLMQHGGHRYWRSNWVDCFFFTNGSLLKALSYFVLPVPIRRWESDPKLSSGVGQQISVRLYRSRYGMYQAADTLLHHGELPSLMNPEEREGNPLKA